MVSMNTLRYLRRNDDAMKNTGWYQPFLNTPASIAQKGIAWFNVFKRTVNWYGCRQNIFGL